MKNKNTKKLQLTKHTITRINESIVLKLKGGTLPASIPETLSARGSQCGDQMCY